ncbi:hypothetical protein [Crocinitomix catalasitica]|uniref:hypothetical protein n=1 Tax=Crocinitomix catalasitica TaxID=184607 RepID=UPI000485D77F|nr:hypothetical protein [Crocinitomix catalasitica]
MVLLFAISKFKDRNFLSLSGGEKQQVHFAHIVAQIIPQDDQLKIILLDEPLNFLDPISIIINESLKRDFIA